MDISTKRCDYNNKEEVNNQNILSNNETNWHEEEEKTFTMNSGIWVNQDFWPEILG